jgi:transposase-like protein
VSQRWRKYSPEFRRKALEGMEVCANVSALARELGIRRKWLYEWRDEAAARAKKKAKGAGEEEKTAHQQEIDALKERIAELQQLVGRQTAEIDFFKGALRRIKEQRQKNGETGGTASTTKSES